MTAPIVTLAAAVVTELNSPVSTTWSQTFTAARTYRIRRNLESLGADTWYVDVVMADETSEILSRAATQDDAEIDIAIHKKCNPDALAEVDPILNLQDEFKSYWLRRRPAASSTQTCIGAEKRARLTFRLFQ